MNAIAKQQSAAPPISLLRRQLHRLLIIKMNRAGWQTHFTPAVTAMKRQFLLRYCGVYSSKDLDAGMCEFAIEQLRDVAISAPRNIHHKRPSVDQRKRVVRLGRYVLGAVYGQNWFWKKLPEWIGELYDGQTDPETGEDLSKRRVRQLENLTSYEAWYIIQRMEKIEAKLHHEGRL
jgi:hypothetical protein